MKELIITLILAKGQLMHIEIFDISCADWYKKNHGEKATRVIKCSQQYGRTL